jgi:phosphate transport system substrate-binding protein
MTKKTLLLAALLASGTAHAADPVLVTGAGATFPNPLYSKWFAEYNKLNPAIRFNYQSIGSGGGIQQFTAGTVAFGATDAPMSAEELSRAPDAVHVPMVLGAVVLVYNAPFSGLKLTPALVEGIFLGKIAKWNDPAMAKVNPGVQLPDAPITVVRRSDGSGTTYVFTEYLASISPAWKQKVGAGKSVSWPVGLGGKGNEGVTGLVKQAPGAIGYVELAYARQNKLPTAALQNRDGNFVSPSTEATSAAAAGVAIPDDYRVSLVNPAGKDAWPIASFTYLLVHKDMKDKAKGDALVKFLWWAVHQGQGLAAPLDYAPLPLPVVRKLEKTIQGLQVQGKPVPLADAR